MHAEEMTREEKFMDLALQQAQTAFACDEVPVGCVFVRGDSVIVGFLFVCLFSQLLVNKKRPSILKQEKNVQQLSMCVCLINVCVIT